MRRSIAVSAGAVCAAAICLPCARTLAWGDEGHEVIGLIAEHYLEPAVRRRVQALLAGDESGLTAKDIAHEATWADKYRDSDRNSAKVRYTQTRNWHFVDLEIAGADIRRACFGQPALAPATDASAGPAEASVPGLSAGWPKQARRMSAPASSRSTKCQLRVCA